MVSQGSIARKPGGRRSVNNLFGTFAWVKGGVIGVWTVRLASIGARFTGRSSALFLRFGVVGLHLAHCLGKHGGSGKENARFAAYPRFRPGRALSPPKSARPRLYPTL